MGGSADRITARLDEAYTPGLPLDAALALAVNALGSDGEDGSTRTFEADQLEVAVLDRTRDRRLFRRLVGQRLESLLPRDPTAS
jgi:proteasome alpha subunit